MEYIENVFPLAIGKTMLEAAMFEFALGIIFTINDAIDKKIPNTAYRIPENLIISSLYLEDVKENVKIELSPDNAALEKRFLDLTTTNLQKIIEKATLNSTN